jgi:hypothetical protein
VGTKRRAAHSKLPSHCELYEQHPRMLITMWGSGRVAYIASVELSNKSANRKMRRISISRVGASVPFILFTLLVVTRITHLNSVSGHPGHLISSRGSIHSRIATRSDSRQVGRWGFGQDSSDWSNGITSHTISSIPDPTLGLTHQHRPAWEVPSGGLCGCLWEPSGSWSSGIYRCTMESL